MGAAATLRAIGTRCSQRALFYSHSRALATCSRKNIAREPAPSITQFQLHRRLPISSVISARCFSEDINDKILDFHEFKLCIGSQEHLVIDVREPKELVEDGRIIGTINIPLGQVDGEFSRPPKEFRAKYYCLNYDRNGANIVFFCRSGVRAEKARNIVEKHGYTRARIYKGSFLDWVERGGDTIK